MFDLERLPKQAGNYVIVAYAAQPFSLEMKKFGLLELQAGYYLYCGSAHGPGGLRSRVSRHLEGETKKFWHYDYLKGYLLPECVWWQVNPVNFECETAQFLAGMTAANCVVKGFGASDCRRGCLSHLIHFPNKTHVNQAWKALDKQNWQYAQMCMEADINRLKS
jgi:Uri superfamily endonuclease